MAGAGVRTATLLALALSFVMPPVAAQTHVVIVSGLGGDDAHRDRFHSWASMLIDAAVSRFHLPDSNIVYLAERPDMDPGTIGGRSTRENIESTLRDLANRVSADGEVFILLIGHGSYQGEQSRFSLPGPDMTAADFSELLSLFPSQRVAFVNTASAGGDFVSVLSDERRTIISATKSPLERNETIFCGFFIEAFSSDVADVDHDERVSILEAFNYARLEVRRFYDSENRLLTEHAVLDDNGDGEGSEEPDVMASDGSLAAQFLFDVRPATSGVSVVDDPELASLYERQRELQQNVADLRSRKEQMETAAYENELERVLLDLARTAAEIRRRGGDGGGGQ